MECKFLYVRSIEGSLLSLNMLTSLCGTSVLYTKTVNKDNSSLPNNLYYYTHVHCVLYHDAWVYQRSHHSLQYSCTVGGAFEARVYPCTLGYNEASMATVVTDKTNCHKKTFFCKCTKRTACCNTVQKYTLNTPKTSQVL